MSKHTAGPYKAHVSEPSWYSMEARFFEVTDEGGQIIAFVKEWSDAPRESKANTKLLAAAPELLSIAKRWAALDGTAWHPERYEAEKRELLAATNDVIAKATA